MAKEVVKHFRLTAHDAGIFADKAKDAGMKESEYFRLLITQEPNDYPEVRQGLKALINEVNRIGVNINAIPAVFSVCPGLRCLYASSFSCTPSGTLPSAAIIACNAHSTAICSYFRG